MGVEQESVNNSMEMLSSMDICLMMSLCKEGSTSPMEISSWALSRIMRWSKEHTYVLRISLKLLELLSRMENSQARLNLLNGLTTK